MVMMAGSATARSSRRARRPARRKATARLPQALRPLFWEYRTARVDVRRDRDLVLRRVLAQGGWREALLIRSRFGDAAIRDFLLLSEARGLSAARIRFWELVLDLPRRRADAWVRRARRGTWERRRRA